MPWGLVRYVSCLAEIVNLRRMVITLTQLEVKIGKVLGIKPKA